MELEKFLSKLDGVKRLPSGYAARCPAHDDKVASLSVNTGREGGIVVKCHAGCDTADVMKALDLVMSDLAGKPHITDEYVYTDENGRPLWTVERWANPKDFRCRPGLPPAAERMLYRSDAIRWAREQGTPQTVWIFEGEKDANRAAYDYDMVTTCNVGGAGSWLPHYAEQLRGLDVVVVADNDEPGKAHARAVAASCETTASSVVVVTPRYGKDASELLDLGWTLDALDPLPEAGRLGLIQARNVIVRPITWLWPGYVARGKVHLIEGDPGCGKSTLVMDLVARWTSASPMPDGQRLGFPISAVVISAEDGAADTTVPRLIVAGAHLERVYLVTAGTDPGRPFTLSRDLPALTEQVQAIGVGVVTLDPLMALLGDDVDAHSDHSVRRALWPLHQFAEDTGAAVLVVRHLNKGGGKAIYRGGGSIGIGGAARAVYTVGRDPENPSRRILANVKMNIAREPESLAYSIEGGEKGPYVEWHGVIDASAQEVVDGAFQEDDADIIYFLNTVVENGEPMSWRDITSAGRKEGYTEKQLRTRRGRSRLVKVIGHEGNRSIRWGYLEHTLAHLPDALPLAPTTPDIPVPSVPPERADGSTAPLGPTQGHGDSGLRGGKWEGERQAADDDEDARERELDSRPLVCEVCQTEELVSRFGSPWWVVRCANHNPITYRGGA